MSVFGALTALKLVVDANRERKIKKALQEHGLSETFVGNAMVAVYWLGFSMREKRRIVKKNPNFDSFEKFEKQMAQHLWIMLAIEDVAELLVGKEKARELTPIARVQAQLIYEGADIS